MITKRIRAGYLPYEIALFTVLPYYAISVDILASIYRQGEPAPAHQLPPAMSEQCPQLPPSRAMRFAPSSEERRMDRDQQWYTWHEFEDFLLHRTGSGQRRL